MSPCRATIVVIGSLCSTHMAQLAEIICDIRAISSEQGAKDVSEKHSDQLDDVLKHVR